MQEIHLKVTIFLIYIIGFVLFSVLGLWLIESLADEKFSAWWSLLFGFIGVSICKEIFDDLMIVTEDDKKYKQWLAYVLPSVFIFVIFIPVWLITYVLLSPLYLIYLCGYLIGLGLKDAKNK